MVRKLNRSDGRASGKSNRPRQPACADSGSDDGAEASASERNPGLPFDADWFSDVRVNRSASERRAATLPGRRGVKKADQAAWLIKAMQCIDLTTLSGDDTPGRVRRLCAKARAPLGRALAQELGLSPTRYPCAAVCVYHAMVGVAVEALDGTTIPVAAVSTGFPSGLSDAQTKVREIEASVKAGAREIDIVISRHLVLTGRWQALYDEVRRYREAVGAAHLKAILATGELATLTNVARASRVCMMAGADFIKTSTGKESVNATLTVALVMLRAIRDYEKHTGFRVGFKPAGGLSTARDALNHLFLVKEELGDDWLGPKRFRFGASSLLGDIERQLEHYVRNAYAAAHRHAMA